MKVVLTYGTFDLFHHGHLRLLKSLSELGDKLIVGLSTDEFNEIKKKKSVMPYEVRKEILLGCRYVDEVFPEENWGQKRMDIIRERVDVFSMGSDWAGEFDDLSDIVEVTYLPRTEGISTTQLKDYMRSLQNDKIQEIRLLAQRIEKCVNGL